MIQVIGKEFSSQTRFVRTYLDNKGVSYEYIDIDFDEDIRIWLKMNKVMGLPVVKSGSSFIVGKNIEALEKLINNP